MLEGVRGLGLGLIVTAPIYRIEQAGFGPLELVLAGTALEVAYFVSEVPTGVVADVYSRRLSCIIGAFVMGAGWLLEGSIAALWPIMLAQAMLGSGWTFFSGASEAWVAGEIGDKAAGRAIVRGQQSNLVFVIVGGFVGAGLATVGLNIPILVAGASHVALGVLLIALMRETGFVRGEHASRLAAVTSTFRAGATAVRRNRVLLLILGATFLTGAASEGLDRLWEAHLYTDFELPGLGSISQLYWFAIVGGVATALSVAALGYSRRFVERESDRALATTAVVLIAGIAGGSAVFGLAPAFALAVGAYWAVRICRNVLHPTIVVWIVRHSSPAVRATVISLEGQSHSIGEIASGFPLGLIGRLVSIPAALVTSGILQALALPFFARDVVRPSAGTPVPVDLEPLPSGPGAEPVTEL
ncbi:MAG TPA: MFS transporter [Actinomycetota bacterium]|nr:MFS transporter [Actinomycetota bacterium]